MEKLLLIGSGGFGRVTLEHAMNNYDCYFVDDGYSVGDTVCNVPIVGHIDDLEDLYKDYKNLVCTIGNNSIRESIYSRARKIGYIFPNIVCDSAYISTFAEVGEGRVILNNVVIQNGSHVGDGVILNPGVEVHHDSFVDDYCCIYTNSVVRTYAKVGKQIRLGSNVTIGNEAVVEQDSLIGDGIAIEK